MNKLYIYCFLILVLVIGFLSPSDIFADQTENSQEIQHDKATEDAYDRINWIDLKQKEREEEENWYQRFRAIFYRERTKESLTGDDITIIETLEVGDDTDSSDSNPVSIIKIEN